MQLSPAAAVPHAAFDRVWQDECLPVTRVRFRGLPHPDAEDATQEVALRLARIFPKKVAARDAALAAGRAFRMSWRAYTNTTCKHVLADFYKDRADSLEAFGHVQSLDNFPTGPVRHRRDDETFPDSLTVADLVPDPRASYDPVAWVTTADLSSLIRRTVAALPPQQRTIIRAHLHGATDKEAAAEANLPESTTYRRRLTATLHLQEALHAAGYGLSYPVGAPQRRTRKGS